MANERILIVEDEIQVATLLERYLKRSGYSVCARAETGAEALQLARQWRPHLVLMDIEIKGEMDGVETAEQLHDQFDTPVVFLTGLTDDATLSRVQKSDSFGYLVKPFRPMELKAGIELAFKKHRQERKLKNIEHWFSAAIKAIADAVITTDEEGTITFINPVAEVLTGRDPRQALGRDLGEVFHVPDREGGMSVKHLVAQMLRKGSSNGFPREAVLRTADGREIPVEANLSPIRNDQRQIVGAVLIFRDISERRQVEDDLNRSREQFRSLAAHLQSVREEERTRIAREIHDEFGQLVTGLKMELAWLENKILLTNKPAPVARLLEKTRSMSEMLDLMVQSVRKISAELRPGVLDNLGLTAALEWQAREFQARTGIRCKIKSDLEDAQLDGDLSTAVFRIFQESLTNVARHAGATSVAVNFKAEAGQLLLTVRDNGRGITDAEASESRSFGLLGVRERVLIFGGEFTIKGAPNQGTTLTVSFPVRRISKQTQSL